MPRLRSHGPTDRRRGFYVEYRGSTLQTTPRADRLFRVSRHYRGGAALPVVVVATLVHLGEATPDDWTPKAEFLARIPRLNPGQCELGADGLAELRRFAERRLADVGLPPAELAAFDAFVREQTPMDAFGEDDRYLRAP